MGIFIEKQRKKERQFALGMKWLKEDLNRPGTAHLHNGTHIIIYAIAYIQMKEFNLQLFFDYDMVNAYLFNRYSDRYLKFNLQVNFSVEGEKVFLL